MLVVSGVLRPARQAICRSMAAKLPKACGGRYACHATYLRNYGSSTVSTYARPNNWKIICAMQSCTNTLNTFPCLFTLRIFCPVRISLPFHFVWHSPHPPHPPYHTNTHSVPHPAYRWNWIRRTTTTISTLASKYVSATHFVLRWSIRCGLTASVYEHLLST